MRGNWKEGGRHRGRWEGEGGKGREGGGRKKGRGHDTRSCNSLP